MDLTPAQITAQMLARDTFSAWLGVEVLAVAAGSATVRFTVREEMCNGHGTAHGGIAHAVADSAFAFACNSHGVKAVAAETATSYLRPLIPGDLVTAAATELHRGRRLGRYRVALERAGEPVAIFHATCYYLDEAWSLPEADEAPTP